MFNSLSLLIKGGPEREYKNKYTERFRGLTGLTPRLDWKLVWESSGWHGPRHDQPSSAAVAYVTLDRINYWVYAQIILEGQARFNVLGADKWRQGPDPIILMGVATKPNWDWTQLRYMPDTSIVAHYLMQVRLAELRLVQQDIASRLR